MLPDAKGPRPNANEPPAANNAALPIGDFATFLIVLHTPFTAFLIPFAIPVSYTTSPSPRDGLLSRMPSSA